MHQLFSIDDLFRFVINQLSRRDSICFYSNIAGFETIYCTVLDSSGFV